MINWSLPSLHWSRFQHFRCASCRFDAQTTCSSFSQAQIHKKTALVHAQAREDFFYRRIQDFAFGAKADEGPEGACHGFTCSYMVINKRSIHIPEILQMHSHTSSAQHTPRESARSPVRIFRKRQKYTKRPGAMELQTRPHSTFSSHTKHRPVSGCCWVLKPLQTTNSYTKTSSVLAAHRGGIHVNHAEVQVMLQTW